MLSLMLYTTAVQNLLQQKTVQRSTNTVHQTMPPVCQAAPPVCQTVPVCAWVLTVWPFPSCRALTLLSLRYSLRLFTKLLGNKGMMKLTCTVQATTSFDAPNLPYAQTSRITSSRITDDSNTNEILTYLLLLSEVNWQWIGRNKIPESKLESGSTASS